jgi:hypothetical protein
MNGCKHARHMIFRTALQPNRQVEVEAIGAL